MRWFIVDLHIHTALSPCADDAMTPGNIVGCALEVGLDAIAITDHNSAKNCRAVVNTAKDTRLQVLSGLEVTSREEVHVLCIFDDPAKAERFQEVIYANLPCRKNNVSIFGSQTVFDEKGIMTGEETWLLSCACNLGLDQLAFMTRHSGGLCIPAHINRERGGLLNVLGLLPPGLAADGLEVSERYGRRPDPERHGGHALLLNSDAHRPSDIRQGRTALYVRELSVSEMRMALKGAYGRRAVAWV
ncbi:MAG: PHP domain-containing protein [Bacillota bacterium]